nr:J503 [uncultured bacterium]
MIETLTMPLKLRALRQFVEALWPVGGQFARWIISASMPHPNR